MYQFIQVVFYWQILRLFPVFCFYKKIPHWFPCVYVFSYFISVSLWYIPRRGNTRSKGDWLHNFARYNLTLCEVIPLVFPVAKCEKDVFTLPHQRVFCEALGVLPTRKMGNGTILYFWFACLWCWVKLGIFPVLTNCFAFSMDCVFPSLARFSDTLTMWCLSFPD